MTDRPVPTWPILHDGCHAPRGYHEGDAGKDYSAIGHVEEYPNEFHIFYRNARRPRLVVDRETYLEACRNDK